MDHRLTPALAVEVITLPVSNVDPAVRFYLDKVGFELYVDYAPTDAFRVVQLTPPGSCCSIQLGIGRTDAAVGSVRNTYLVVSDLPAARERLVKRGVQVSEIRHKTPAGAWDGGFAPGLDPDRGDYASIADFADPDGKHVGAAGTTPAPLASQPRQLRSTPLADAAAAKLLRDGELSGRKRGWGSRFVSARRTLQRPLPLLGREDKMRSAPSATACEIAVLLTTPPSMSCRSRIRTGGKSPGTAAVAGYHIHRRSFGEENLAAFIVIERHDVERKVGRSHSYHQPSA